MHPNLKGYWVTLYFVYDGERTYTFFDEATWIDNCLLMAESGYIHSFTKDILVTPDKFPSMYKQISDLENVLKSDSN